MKLRDFAEIVNKAAEYGPEKEVKAVRRDGVLMPVLEAFVNDNPFAGTDFLIITQDAKDWEAEQKTKSPMEQVVDFFARSNTNTETKP